MDLQVVCTDCDVAHLLENVLLLQDAQEDCGQEGEIDVTTDISSLSESIFSLSPLTSPSSSPSSSPSLSPAALPPDPPPPSPTIDPASQDYISDMPPLVPCTHRQRGKTARRRKSRRDARGSRDAFSYKPRSSAARKQQDLKAVACSVDARCLQAAKGAWIGKRVQIRRGLRRLGQLQEEGLKLVHWDGRTPLAITDSQGRIIAFLVGRPVGDDGWDGVCERAERAMQVAAQRLHFGNRLCLPTPPGGAKDNRRGAFRTVAAGVSYGGGQKRLSNLRHTAHNEAVIEDLTGHADVQRMLAFGSSAFALFAPKLYRYYSKTLQTLFEADPLLKPNSMKSIFPTVSYNFGPSVITYEHTDFNNLPFGWCWVQSGGHYNSKYGGHLILRTLGLVVEFPPGASMLIPSGSVQHGNVPILKGETRTSFTQYAPGGLFRWVHYGHRTWKSLSKAEQKEARENAKGRVEEALSLFSTVDSLLHDLNHVII